VAEHTPPPPAVPVDVDSLESELDGEERLGSSAAGMAANAALRALSKAARSVLLYEVNNEAIRRFIEEYREAVAEAVLHGPLELQLRPFEILAAGEIVYLERDRERSLAFRLFRDGVRRLRIDPSVTWEELFQLLEILSIRYVGIRQNEDDVVTLLWKAGFEGIQVVAVEGFVLEEDQGSHGDDGGSWDGLGQQALAADVPQDWDLPSPVHDRGSPMPVYRSVDDRVLAQLREEVASSRLTDHALRLVGEMLALVHDKADPTSLSDLQHYLAEVRDFLLAEGQIGHLLTLARHLASLDEEVTGRIRDVQLGLADRDALQRIIGSVSRTATAPPPELIGLLETVPGDHVASLVAILENERDATRRLVARELLERFVGDRVDYVRDRLATAEPRIAADLLDAVGRVDLGEGLRLAGIVALSPDRPVQNVIAEMLSRADGSEIDTRELTRLLRSPSVELRMRVIELLEARGDRRAFRKLITHLDRDADRIGRVEAQAVGRTMASIHPSRVLRDVTEWVRPRGMFARLRTRVDRATPRVWAGVAALATIDDVVAEECIMWLARNSGTEIRDACQHVLAQRRDRGVSRG
jgi:hypothetical protein